MGVLRSTRPYAIQIVGESPLQGIERSWAADSYRAQV